MKPESVSLMHKAQESFEVARQLCQQEHLDFAAGRAYYAMYYLAEAALLEKDQAFSSHRSLHSGFFQEFTRTGIVDRVHHQSLVRGFELRQAGDYGGFASVSQDQCDDLLDRAEAFLNAVGSLLDPS